MNWMLVLMALGAVGLLAVVVVFIALFAQRDAHRQKEGTDKPEAEGDLK